MSKTTAAAKQSRTPSSPDMVVTAINDAILRQRYSIGQRLVESDLTRDLKVSRGTVREALKKLSAEGVVQLSPHRGAVTAPYRARTRRRCCLCWRRFVV